MDKACKTALPTERKKEKRSRERQRSRAVRFRAVSASCRAGRESRLMLLRLLHSTQKTHTKASKIKHVTTWRLPCCCNSGASRSNHLQTCWDSDGAREAMVPSPCGSGQSQCGWQLSAMGRRGCAIYRSRDYIIRRVAPLKRQPMSEQLANYYRQVSTGRLDKQIDS